VNRPLTQKISAKQTKPKVTFDIKEDRNIDIEEG
jgi:hypothetical protein